MKANELSKSTNGDPESEPADPIDALMAITEEHNKTLRRIEAKLEKLIQAVERLDTNF